MKNIGPFLAFDRRWFKRNQRVMLWFLNAPIIKYGSRWILRINGNRSGVGPNKILEIFPHAIRWSPVTGHEKMEFRTHAKFSKRIYFAFKPFWWVLHFWDWLLADRFEFAHQWSYGFLTLTVNPDPNPETTTVDGVSIYDAVDTWANVRASGVGNSTFDSVDESLMMDARLVSAGRYILARSFFLFDTSPLTSAAIITAVVFSVKPHSTASGTITDGTDIHIVSSSPASNTALVDQDYDQVGSTSFASMAGWTASDSTYRDFTLNANGRANVSKTGVSKFGARGSRDLLDQAPTVGANQSLCRYADFAGTTDDPKLVVTYTLPTTVAKTIQVKARIRTSGVAKTVTAKARSKTIGVAKTIRSKGRIKTANLAKTVSAKARIFNITLTKGISAKARIINPAGYFRLRSNDEIYQQSLKDQGYSELRGQEYPASMKDDRIKL